MSGEAVPPRASRRRWARAAAVLACAALVALFVGWCLFLAGRPLPEAGNRALSALALSAGAGWAALAAWRAAQHTAGRWLVALLALSLALRLSGLEFEIAERYYEDEGIYTANLTDINAGEVLRPSFVYPHLTYYLFAFVVWVASNSGETAVALARSLYGVADWGLTVRLLVRLTVGFISALAVLPVFALARRLGGLAAGIVAGALLACSPLFNEISHLGICDAPAAVFAACALFFVVRLGERESRRDYLLAGLFAGLAAAAKYPAGAVAIGIVAVWLGGRWRSRRLTWDLALAGGAALAVFLIANPALVVAPRASLVGEYGLAFGARLYGGAGWVGVAPPSRAAYYAGLLAESFGLAALASAAAGLALLPRHRWRALVWLLPFPLAYALLIGSVTIAVERNALNLIPPLAILCGVGLAQVAERLGELAARTTTSGASGARRLAALALPLLTALAEPVVATLGQSVGFNRPGTRVLAREWVRANVARGATIAREEYTPGFSPVEFVSWTPAGVRFAADIPAAELLHPDVDLLLLSSGSYARFFAPEAPRPPVDPQVERARARYESFFRAFPLLAEFSPSRTRLGPRVEVRQVVAREWEFLRERRWSAVEAFVPDAGMRPPGSEVVSYTLPGQWAMWKAPLAAGCFRLRLEGDLAGAGFVRLTDLGARETARFAVSRATDPVDFCQPAAAKLFVYPHLAAGSRITGLAVAAR